MIPRQKRVFGVEGKYPAKYPAPHDGRSLVGVSPTYLAIYLPE